MVTVSYVATLYNKRPFVPYLVAGLEAQAGDFARELIFVDDGSTDGTAELLESLLAGRKSARVIRQANSGQGAALNRGFAAAAGDYIKAMDGDDMLAPWATRRLLDAIAESGCRVARTDMGAQLFIDQGRTPAEHLAGAKETITPAIRETDLLRHSLQIVRMNPSAWLAERSLVAEIGGADPAPFIADYSLELEFGLRGPVALVAAPLMWVARQGAQSLSSNQAQCLHDVNLILLRFLCRHPELPAATVRYALRRASGRAWAWARRKAGATIFSPSFRTLLLARLGLLRPDARLEAALCGPFRATSPIRLGN